MASRLTYPPGLQAAAAEMGVKLPKYEKFEAREALLELSTAFDTAAMNGEDSYADFGGFSFKKLGRGIGKIGKGAVKGVKGAVKGVGKGIKAVASSPIAQVLNPALAIGVHTTDKALGGKGVIKGAAGKLVDAGTSVVMSNPAVKAAATLGNPAAKAALSSLAKPAHALAPMAALGKKFAPALPAVARTHTGITSGKAVSFGVPSNAIPLKQAMAGADKLLGDPNVKNAHAVVRNTKALAALGDPSAQRGLAVLAAVGHIRLAKATPPGKRAVSHVLTIPPAKLTVTHSATAVRQLAKKKVEQHPKGFWTRVIAWLKA